MLYRLIKERKEVKDMARITEVNYKEIPRKVKQMKDGAMNINNEMFSSYNKIIDMRSDWYGEKYNELAVKCNRVAPDIEKLLVLIVTDIPYSLEEIANNYSVADTGSKVVNQLKVTIKKIPHVELTQINSMRFIQPEVIRVKDEVSTSFGKALNELDVFQKVFDSITWNSEAAEVYRREFLESKNKVKSLLADIKKLFETLIKESTEIIEKAESSNTLK